MQSLTSNSEHQHKIHVFGQSSQSSTAQHKKTRFLWSGKTVDGLARGDICLNANQSCRQSLKRSNGNYWTKFGDDRHGMTEALFLPSARWDDEELRNHDHLKQFRMIISFFPPSHPVPDLSLLHQMLGTITVPNLCHDWVHWVESSIPVSNPVPNSSYQAYVAKPTSLTYVWRTGIISFGTIRSMQSS